MTGYKSKKEMARNKLAQPAQEPVAWMEEHMKQKLLVRVHRELLDVLNSINQDKIHHDGDDFHELLIDVEKALAQPAQEPVANDRTLQLVTYQMNHWRAYALELQERLVKYEGGAPMLLNKDKNT